MYRMAGYCRLSKEDGENRISESIENQMRLISEYVDKAGDMKLVRMYIDDGYSEPPTVSADDGGYLQRRDSGSDHKRYFKTWA